MDVRIAFLADHPEVLSPLAAALERASSHWYGVHADAVADLRARSRRTGLPFGLVALDDDAPVGTIGIVPQSTASHAYLSPWIVGLWVEPRHRNRGIGAKLLKEACEQAHHMGFTQLYASTARARRPPPQWESIGAGTSEGGDAVDIYRIALG